MGLKNAWRSKGVELRKEELEPRPNVAEIPESAEGPVFMSRRKGEERSSG